MKDKFRVTLKPVRPANAREFSLIIVAKSPVKAQALANLMSQELSATIVSVAANK